jgi:hypothetical protein
VPKINDIPRHSMPGTHGPLLTKTDSIRRIAKVRMYGRPIIALGSPSVVAATCLANVLREGRR